MQKRVNLVDLEKSLKMRLLSLSEASIQKRTSTAKFARSPCTDPPGSELPEPGSKASLEVGAVRDASR